MTRDVFSCFLGFQNFSGEAPKPPFQTNVLKFQSSNIQSTQHLVRSEVFKSKSENNVREKERSSTTIICDKLAINLLAKDLLYPYHTII